MFETNSPAGFGSTVVVVVVVVFEVVSSFTDDSALTGTGSSVLMAATIDFVTPDGDFGGSSCFLVFSSSLSLSANKSSSSSEFSPEGGISFSLVMVAGIRLCCLCLNTVDQMFGRLSFFLDYCVGDGDTTTHVIGLFQDRR